MEFPYLPLLPYQIGSNPYTQTNMGYSFVPLKGFAEFVLRPQNVDLNLPRLVSSKSLI